MVSQIHPPALISIHKLPPTAARSREDAVDMWSTTCCSSTPSTQNVPAGCTFCINAGVHFCHKHGVAHRDLKLENTLLKHEVTQPGAAPIPVLKIADFGFCKHELMHTPPDSRVGTPAYISPVRLDLFPAHAAPCVVAACTAASTGRSAAKQCDHGVC